MARGVTGFEEFYDYVNQMNIAMNEFNQFLTNFLLEMAERLIAKTKEKTPKDTGALRNSWTIGSLSGNGRDLQVEILNHMEYATHVEYGHNTVNGENFVLGRYMLTVSLDEIYGAMPAKFESDFYSWCKEMGVGE